MLYKFDLKITIESKSELLKEKGQKIERITRDTVGEQRFMFIRIDYANGYTFVCNNVDLHPDYKDEYPQFVVSKVQDIEFREDITHPIGKRIIDIQLVTDYVAWEYGKDVWDVEADIGILFTLDDGEEILIEAMDSLAGFMVYHQARNTLNQLRSIEEQWQMKADKLIRAKRVIRDL